MEPVRRLRALVAVVVVTAFLAFPGGLASSPPSVAARAASTSVLKARALYFHKAGKTGQRDFMVSALASRDAWQAELWSGFLDTWSTINDSMRMNRTVPSGLPARGHVFVVLGSALKSSGAMSPKFERRLELAVKALKKYPKAKVLVSGGAARNGVTEAAAGRRWLLRKGLAEKRILVEQKSASTIGNAKYSMALLATTGTTSYSIISDSSHLRRASVLFEAAEVLVQEQTGRAWPIRRLANVAYPDMAAAGLVPLSSSSVAYATSNVASVLGLSSAYAQVVSAPPRAATLTAVELTPPQQLVYAAGEQLDTSGLRVTAVYDEGVYARVVTPQVELAGFRSDAVGTGTVTATYAEDDVVQQASFGYQVVKARGALALELSTDTPRRARTRVRVLASATTPTGLVPSGTVRFYLDGELLRSSRLEAGKPGVAGFTYPAIAKAGRHRIVVKYLGSDLVEKVRAGATVTVK